MKEIKTAQLFTSGKKKYMFLRFKGGVHKIDCYNLDTKKYQTLGLAKGKEVMNHHSITILDERDFELYAKLMDEQSKLKNEKHEKEVQVRAMKQGQIFIGNDGKRYAFDKFNRTKFEFHAEGNMFDGFTAKPPFVKEITSEMEKKQEFKITRTFTDTQIKEIKEYAELYKDECHLSNEGHIATVTTKVSKIRVQIYNDGFECCAMVDGKYVLGVELYEGALKSAEEHLEQLQRLGLISKKDVC